MENASHAPIQATGTHRLILAPAAPTPTHTTLHPKDANAPHQLLMSTMENASPATILIIGMTPPECVSPVQKPISSMSNSKDVNAPKSYLTILDSNASLVSNPNTGMMIPKSVNNVPLIRITLKARRNASRVQLWLLFGMGNSVWGVRLEPYSMLLLKLVKVAHQGLYSNLLPQDVFAPKIPS